MLLLVLLVPFFLLFLRGCWWEVEGASSASGRSFLGTPRFLLALPFIGVLDKPVTGQLTATTQTARSGRRDQKRGETNRQRHGEERREFGTYQQP